MNPRKTAPTKPTSRDSHLSFVVWVHNPGYSEDPKPWKAAAAFRFLLDALDFIARIQDARLDCVFQSPCETKPIMHTDRRVVYKPEVA